MLDINECERNPCQNNGTCTDKINNYECQCEKGYEGKDCEQGIVPYKSCEKSEKL